MSTARANRYAGAAMARASVARAVTLVATAVAAVLVLGIAVVAAVVNRTTPGDAVTPGVVGLICGASLVTGGVALVVYVMRMLLVQAVGTASQARALQSELDEVI